MQRDIEAIVNALWLSLFVGLVAIWAIDLEKKPVDRVSLQRIEVPCQSGAALPSLTLNEDGIPLISWVDQDQDGYAVIRFSKWQQDRWSSPTEITRGNTWFVNWADFPSMAVLADGTMAVHWLDKISSDTYAYGIKIALSRDGGKSWSDSLIPHTDRSPSEHGFLSLKSMGDRFHLSWLDGRETLKGKPMTLRSRFLFADGSMSQEVLLDDSVCDCCPVDAVVGEKNAITFYRDRDHMEVRDIAWIQQAADSGLPEAADLLHDDQWIQPGCPVNGPAICGSPERWAVVWYTEAERLLQNGNGVVMLRSGGATSTKAERSQPPFKIDAGDPLGRVDICEWGEGDFLVCWMEQNGNSAEISVREWKPGSKPAQRWVVAETSPGRKSGFPRIIQIPGKSQAIVAYTRFDADNRSRVETVLIGE
ncbi:MAG: hypothetical protein CBC13_02270 [Planctomycetia bacterium TMED53]|nr:MAG: hypothetical protein CBC13_02270 [Planctomycetia bacterium TMED53]